jgi:uncharacterized protein (DUF924 family)
MRLAPAPEAVLEAWFGEDLDEPASMAVCIPRWFEADPAFDEFIGGQFGDLPDKALSGDLDTWRSDSRSTLALLIVLDQFPRNLFRRSHRAFAYDGAALEVALGALDAGFDRTLHTLEAMFLYLPLEHAEDRALQDRCVSLFRDLAERAPAPFVEPCDSFLAYAIRHREVVEKFGRFPHRNAVLGRASTPEEIAYLASGGETFS